MYMTRVNFLDSSCNLFIFSVKTVTRNVPKHVSSGWEITIKHKIQINVYDVAIVKDKHLIVINTQII